jgi:transitional endoplasmic reticulum ATPase
VAISDKDFQELVRALRDDPASELLTEAVRSAADTAARRALVRAFGLFATDSDQETADRSSEPPASTDALDTEEEVDRTAANVVNLRRTRPGLQALSGVIGLDDVGGLESVKTQLRRKLLDPLKHPGLFQKFRRRTGGGILLYGPPGCGKTMVVKAVANEANVRLIEVRAAEVLDCAVGISEKKLAAAFAEARASKPCILFFDEVEALAGRRSVGSDFKAGLVSSFLTAFDGLADQNNGILVLAATNTPWAVDTAFRRPGRFDRTLFVPPPHREARESILRSQLEDRPSSGVRVDELVAGTSGFSGADLVNLVETAVDIAIADCIRSDAPERLGMQHLLAAMDEVQPTTTEWLATARNYAKYSNEGGAYNEVLTFLDRHAA